MGVESSEITQGTVDDLQSLAPLWMAMVEHHRAVAGEDLPVRPGLEAWEMRRQEYRRWLEEGNGLLLLAWADGSDLPAGYAFCRLIASGPTFDLGPVRGEVESLVVAPAARGLGAGTALLQACRRELLRRECSYWAVSVMEANRGAVELYERAGFRPWLRELVGRLDADGEG